MGFSEKVQLVEGSLESDNKKWVIAGIALRAPLKPIYTIPSVEKESSRVEDVAVVDHEEEEDEECVTTPTSEESRIPTLLTCPPAPMKPKPSLKCHRYHGGVVRQFFTPPDLDTVFICHVEKAN